MGFFRRRRGRSARCYVIAEASEAGAVRKAGQPAESRRARAAKRSRNRIAMVALVFGLAYAGLAARLAFISIGGSNAYDREVAAAPRDDRPRPDILDRNGVILATNLPMTALEIAGGDVWDAHETATKLAEAFPEINAAALETKLKDGRYVEVLGDLTPEQKERAFRLGLPGVRFAARARRFYPQEALAAHVIGLTEPGKGGVMGLERALDERREDGPLVSSLDIRVQQALEAEIRSIAEKYRAKAGWGIVMNAATGEVIALASYPDFDPNDPAAAPADWRRNRATYDDYELGSAFKTITAAAALETGAASEASVYDARGVYRIAGRTIHDYHPQNRMLSLSEVIQYSSNIGAARIAADLGTDEQRAFIRALGLADALPIELPENRAPQLPDRWGPVETATIAFGHGIAVTPLHLLAAFTAIVNGGEYRTPTFLKATGARPGKRVFSEKTSAIMRRILRRVVTDGTAEYAKAPGYFPIGKTSTADKVENGGYDVSARIASFVGAFPGYAPRFTVMISLDDPQGVKDTYGYATAGWNVAPAFGRLVQRIAPTLGVMPVNEATALAGFYEGYQSADARVRARAGAVGGGE
ncbi:MAG TPA: penicillin-binding protein 2 [Parvularculaceae bacterium]|nr:penicillin-binding protein 2 [Parvularculaceae bacterium]